MKSRFLVLISVFVLVAASTANGRSFRIMIINPETDSLQSEFPVLIAGGYVHNLEIGMTGDVVSISKDNDTVITGTGEVVDVDKYEASCLVRQSGEHPVRSGHRIILRPPEFDRATFIKKGQQAFDAEDFERAKFFLTNAMQTATSEEIAELTPLVEKSQSMVEKEYKRKLTRSEKKQEQSRKSTYLMLARAHLIEGCWIGAKHNYSKILRVDPKNDIAKEVIKRIDELRRFSAEEKNQDSLVDAERTPYMGPAEIFPELIKSTAPDYPRSAKRAGIEGVVWVRALVAETGKVLWAEVQKSSENPELDEAAIAAAYKNKYKPGFQKGKAINCWVAYKVTFELNGPGRR